jgi:hypothetical protein
MFQSFRRAKYISENNFYHWNTQDGARMHLWLQKNGWPANDFVDWFMRVYPKITETSKLRFKLYLTSQFDWVEANDTQSFEWLYELISEPEFQKEDKDKNLTTWLKMIRDLTQ